MGSPTPSVCPKLLDGIVTYSNHLKGYIFLLDDKEYLERIDKDEEPCTEEKGSNAVCI